MFLLTISLVFKDENLKFALQEIQVCVCVCVRAPIEGSHLVCIRQAFKGDKGDVSARIATLFMPPQVC